MRRRTAAPIVLTGVLALVAACGSSSSRAPFTEDAGPPPANTIDERPPDGGPTPGPPVAPVGDAGPQPDASESCATVPPTNACGLVPQCGCTLAETCDVDAAGNVACITAGTRAMGAPCATTASCARGLTCVFGTCHAFCDTPGSACTAPGTGDCLQVKGQDAKDIPNFLVCLVGCKLEDPTTCGGAAVSDHAVCVLFENGKTDCREGGSATEGQACPEGDECGPGLACVSTSGGASTCKKWCRVGTADCGGSTQCTGFKTKLMVGGVEYGACP